MKYLCISVDITMNYAPRLKMNSSKLISILLFRFDKNMFTRKAPPCKKSVRFRFFYYGSHLQVSLSTSPPRNHAVLYIRAIYRISQISNFFAWSDSFWCLKPENTIKSFNMTDVAMRSRVLSNSHFLAKFAMLHIWQTLYFEGIKMLLNFNIYRNWLLFSIHLK